jgi:predicted metal-dependent hydrolase
MGTMGRLQQDDTDPGQLVLQPRDVRFDWSGLPLTWIPGEPATSHVINVLHLLLPEGERWFVSVFKRALPLIRDEALREDVIGFIGQEAIHAEAHQGVLDYFRDHDLDTKPYQRQMEWLFRRILGERANLSPARSREEIAEDVAIVAAIEHITAFLGDWVLNAPALDRAGAHPVMLDLLRWHGAEEVEHRHVAFDLMVHLDPAYARRIRGTALAWPLLVFLWARGARFLVRIDPDLDRTVKASWRGALAAARRGLLPTPGATVKSAGQYLRSGYHPSQQFSTRQAVAYLGASPAARAAEQ